MATELDTRFEGKDEVSLSPQFRKRLTRLLLEAQEGEPNL